MSQHGAKYTEVPTNSGPNKPTFLQHVGDFANMVKAFIGSNYLSLPFAFSQSGLGFGLGGLLIIVMMTDYCCQLLVKVKHIVVDNIVDTRRIQDKIERASTPSSQSSSSSSFSSSGSASGTTEEDEMAIHAFHQHIMKSLSYQDIGRIVFGRPGSFIVQACLLLTQFGFCIGYFVFLGNTIYSMFPVKIVENNNRSMENASFVLPHYSSTVVPILNYSTTSNYIRNGTIGFSSTQNSLLNQSYSRPLSEVSTTSPFVSTTQTQSFRTASISSTQGALQTTSTTPVNLNGSESVRNHSYTSGSSKTSNMSEIMEGKGGMIAAVNKSINTTVNTNFSTAANEDSSLIAKGNGSTSSSGNPNVSPNGSLATNISGMASKDIPQNRTKRHLEKVEESGDTVPSYAPQGEVFSLSGTSTEGWNQTVISTAPALQYLVLVPGPVFILFSWIRHVRSMGPISLIANLAILAGFVSVLGYMIVGFTISETVVWFKLQTFPIFFGQVTTAYEGIGLIIPIESSMENNRHSFANFLHGAVLLVSCVLGTFGILGYLRYGDDTDQMINQNLEPQHSPLTLLVSATLCVGIVFTFPLQLMPVVEITEGFLFAEGKICGPSSDADDEEKGEEECDRDDASLLPGVKVPKSDVPEHVSTHIPVSVPAWKRNIWRTCLVLFCAGFAVLLRAKFAYIGAFIGSVGGTMLMYILPCICHLKLRWHRLPCCRIILEICITVIGTAGGTMGLYAVIKDMVTTLS